MDAVAEIKIDSLKSITDGSVSCADGLAGVVNKMICCILIATLCGCQAVQRQAAQRQAAQRQATQHQATQHQATQHQATQHRWVQAFGAKKQVAVQPLDDTDAGRVVISDQNPAKPVTPVSFQQEAAAVPSVSADDQSPIVDLSAPAVEVLATDNAAIGLSDVVSSVHESYPLVFAAFQERNIADGDHVSAWGSFDTKLKATSENGPLGFYKTYRNSAGLTKPIYSGGEFFAGYRIGDGTFQPWYEERETDEGGEFKAGFRVPLVRGRDIDGRRADLWRANYNRQLADPYIRTQLVVFAREASLAYWKWVAACEKYKLGLKWVALAEDRNQRVIDQKEAGQLAIADVRDNEAAIAKRQAKLAEAQNELRQASVKLGLYFRDPDGGKPIIPESHRSPGFPALRASSEEGFSVDVPAAQAARPELKALSIQLSKLHVDYAEAVNLTKAGLDAQITGSQDVGADASSSEDKGDFELEVGLFFEVPLERRKGLGKMHSVQAKMAAVSAKRRLVQEKVTGEVMIVYAALEETRRQAEQATESVKLYNFVAENERVLFENGESDLLKVVLREQYALEAAEEQITAFHNHFVAFTEYAAVLAIDRPAVDLLPAVPTVDAEDVQQ